MWGGELETVQEDGWAGLGLKVGPDVSQMPPPIFSPPLSSHLARPLQQGLLERGMWQWNLGQHPL